MRDESPAEVLIVGGGYATSRRIPCRPRPFAARHALRAPLDELAEAAGAMLRHGRLAAVASDAHQVRPTTRRRSPTTRC